MATKRKRPQEASSGAVPTSSSVKKPRLEVDPFLSSEAKISDIKVTESTKEVGQKIKTYTHCQLNLIATRLVRAYPELEEDVLSEVEKIAPAMEGEKLETEGKSEPTTVKDKTVEIKDREERVRRGEEPSEDG
eukprot:CAMPEP_0174252832 /NCGR_PEP_ID=MMETSP0439-20130205/2202_1 /TAXON_ID=0 /ORGANISM="Stereomyxa ramosa, Strain Chinc5" /LENGTH=132 /DNA_ID=CAMNT_0015333479 /DNA_START=19 /DNA_END=414 /DNA_ORIENTATION=-